MQCSFYHINMLTPFLTIFRRFPTTFQRFPKICQNCSERQSNISEHFPKNSEHFPKITKNCRRRPKKTRRCFDYTAKNATITITNHNYDCPMLSKLDSLPIFKGKSYLKLSKLILNWTVLKTKDNSYADNTGLTDCYIINIDKIGVNIDMYSTVS